MESRLRLWYNICKILGKAGSPKKGMRFMSITIDFTPAEIALIKEQATACNTTAEEFIRQASAKAARNAEYLAKLDKGFR